MKPFTLGQVVSTSGVVEKLNQPEIIMMVARHHSQDWGNMDEEDKAQNNERVMIGEGIIHSSYISSSGIKVWIITDWDWSSTTVMLPDEY